MTTAPPEPAPGEDPGLPPDPEVTPVEPFPDPGADPGQLPDAEPQLP